MRADYLKRARDARKHAEALMRSLAEVRRLAEQGKRARLLLPIPGPAENMLRVWLDALDRVEGRGDDAA